MIISEIVAAVNTKLAGETLTYNQVRLFLDDTIDDINSELSAKFPDFTGKNTSDNYSFFPDSYIRSVLVLGAALRFYITDEEGSQAANQYSRDYAYNLFKMKRDYSDKIPPEYQDFDKGYLTPGPDDEDTTTDPYGFFRW